MKILIFDSSSLINFTMNGLIYLLEDLRKIFPGKFIIPEAVKYEIIDRPSGIKKYELGSLQMKRLLDENILELPETIGINSAEIKEKTREILNKVNKSYYARGEFMHIIDEGEAACLALSIIANKEKIENVIVIDERTTRMIVENPENLRKLFQHKLHTKINLKANFDYLKSKFIRSCELVFIAYKKGLVNLKNGKVLEALLYATKYKGCAVSEDEIKQIEKLA